MRVLAVDNEEGIVGLVKASCQRDGHAVAACTSSIDAKSRLEDGEFDLLITDIAMPWLDGLELVREARRLHPSLIAIVMTGHSARYTLAEVLDAGASDLLFKPFPTDELRARVTLAQKRWGLIAGPPPVVPAKIDEMVAEVRQESFSARQPAAADERAIPVFLLSEKALGILAALESLTTNLVEGLSGPVSAAQRESLETTLRHANQLRTQIDELLPLPMRASAR